MAILGFSFQLFPFYLLFLSFFWLSFVLLLPVGKSFSHLFWIFVSSFQQFLLTCCYYDLALKCPPDFHVCGRWLDLEDTILSFGFTHWRVDSWMCCYEARPGEKMHALEEYNFILLLLPSLLPAVRSWILFPLRPPSAALFLHWRQLTMNIKCEPKWTSPNLSCGWQVLHSHKKNVTKTSPVCVILCQALSIQRWDYQWEVWKPIKEKVKFFNWLK